MKKDQNRIALNVRRGIYEEFHLISTDTATVVPGTLLSMKNVGSSTEPLELSSQTSDLDGFEACVVLENGLLGTSMNHKQYAGDLMLVRRLVSGDMYLLRAVAGTYTTGMPLYATQTTNGIYVSSTGAGKFIGWAQENYTVTGTMVGLVDDSTLTQPSSTNLNGVLVNLLRVRIGRKNSNTKINYTVVADGNTTSTDSTKLTFTFGSAISPDLTASAFAITPSSVATKGALTKVSNAVYDLAITPVASGAVSTTVTGTGITSAAKTANVYYYPDDYTVSTDGTAENVPSTKVTFTFGTALTTDLTASDITLTGATAGTLTKISDTVYDLAVSNVTDAVEGTTGSTFTAVITKAGLTTASKTITWYTYALQGYWGVCYPDLRAVGSSAVPTAAEILALSTLHPIYGVKRNLSVAFALNETDWTAAGGTGTFASDGAGRAFLLTKAWGTASAITSSAIDVSTAFDALTLEINSTSYTGYIANSTPTVYDGTVFAFTFVS